MAFTYFYDDSSLPRHCRPVSPYLEYVSRYFETCIPTPLAGLSTLLGVLSLVWWLFAQMPQVYKNYQMKSTAGLSIYFLVEWLAGDLANLLGSIFTKQASWQVVLASYYCFVDCCLVIQHIWYTHLARKVYGESLHSSLSSERGDGDADSINGLSPINTQYHDPFDSLPETSTAETANVSRPILTPRFSQVSYEKKSTPPQSIPYSRSKTPNWAWLPSPSPRTVAFAAIMSVPASRTNAAPVPFPAEEYRHGIHLFRIDTPLEVIGTILAWSSTVLYLASRFPQLHKNWKRKSTAGLSPLLFLAAFCGNFCYSTSLISNPRAWHDYGPHGGHGWVDSHGSQRWAWVANAAPFFLGAAGALAMDALMGMQFWIYGEREEKVIKIRDSDGYTHWQKVSGWMRGWVPSVIGKEKVVDLAESQRLLGESREISRSRHFDYGTA